MPQWSVMKVAVLCFTAWLLGTMIAIQKGLGVQMTSAEEDEGRGGNGGDEEKMDKEVLGFMN